MKPDEARLILVKKYIDRKFSNVDFYFPKIGFHTFEYHFEKDEPMVGNVLAVDEHTGKTFPFQLACYPVNKLGKPKRIEV